jgi:hypothetical protein
MGNNTIATLAYVSVAALAAYCIIGAQVRNGTFDALHKLAAAKPLTLPLSSEIMRLTYTGFAPLDRTLTGIVGFFWICMSGYSSTLGLYSFYMSAQVLPVVVIVLVEGYRVGNAGKLVSLFVSPQRNPIIALRR